jgi:hypothetical protein
MAEIKPSFPSSLPPQLVITWLPLRDISSALCASSSWRDASEPVFKVVAERNGLTRGTDSWRGGVLRHPTWSRSKPARQQYRWPEFTGPRTVTNEVAERDFDLVANSIRVPLHRMARFRVQMKKEELRTTDGCGFALLSGSGAIKRAYVWNSNGNDYTGIGSPLLGRIETFSFKNKRIKSGQTLLVSVWNVPPYHFHATLERVEEDGSLSEIATERDISALDALDDTDDEDAPFVLAPLVRLFTGSSATLGLYEPLAHE